MDGRGQSLLQQMMIQGRILREVKMGETEQQDLESYHGQTCWPRVMKNGVVPSYEDGYPRLPPPLSYVLML
jgi:hypothetical protein